MKRKVLPMLLSAVMLISAPIPVSAAGRSTGSSVNSSQQISVTTPNQNVSSSYFNDIGGHWAQSYIEQWAANGIFGGMGDGTFRPNDTLTRAQFASILVQLFDLQMKSEKNPKNYKVPSDVGSSSWAREVIARCLDNNVMNLRSGSFAPDQPITREEVFYALGTAMNITNIKSGGSDGLSRFIDGNYVSSAARNTIGKMVSLCMINGKGNNKLEPQSYITRGEVSTVLSKSIEYHSESSIKKETFDNAVILNVSSKRGDLTVSNVKVNGNLFITGDNIDTIDLESVNVSGKIYIYANSIEQVNLDNVTDTDFVIICSDVTFEDSDDSDGNTFNFINPNTISFSGEADSIEIEGDYIEEITINGNAGDKIDSLVINGEDSDEIDITLSGYINEAEINGDATIKGYGRIKTLIFDEGDYESDVAGDTTKILSGKLKVNGTSYSKGTYYRSEISGANVPDEKDTNSNNGAYISPSTLTHTTGNIFNTKLYWASNKVVSYLTMDGVTIGSPNYSINYSDNSVLLKSDYVNILSNGYHTLRVFYTDGSYSKVDVNINNSNSGVYISPSVLTHTIGNVFNTKLYYASNKAVSYLTMDNATISSSNYSINYLDSSVLLKSDYINSLSNGYHTLKIFYTDGSYSTVDVTLNYAASNTIVTPRTIYHSKGSIFTTTLTYQSIHNPVSIYIDSTIVPTSYYTIDYVNRRISLNSNYVNSLNYGSHNVKINFADDSYDEIKLTISDNSSSTSFNYDKINGSVYHRDITVNDINTYPTSVYFNNSQLPTSYYQYDSVLKTLTFTTPYLDTFELGTYTVTINTEYGSKKVTIKVSESSKNYTFIFDKNSVSSDYKDIVLSGNISPTGLAIYVGNISLNPNQYEYNSGSVIIKKNVFSNLNTGDYLIRVISTNGTIESSVTVVDTSAMSQIISCSKGNNSDLIISSPYNGVVNKVEFAGNELSSDAYSTNVNSNMITLFKSYLKSYSNQSYNLEISYTNGNKLTHTVVILN